MRSVIGVERQRMSQGALGEAEVDGHPGRAGQSPADPRRRFGRHADARRFLADEGASARGNPGVWAGLLSALRRHTIQASLASLAASERQVLHMAYLEGRTNREIAAILSISQSTVRRRVAVALASLDSQIRRAGTWASAVLLLLLASAVARAQALGRLVSVLRATPTGNLILASVAGAAAGAVVIGAVVSNQGASARDNGPARSSTQVAAGTTMMVLAPVLPTSTTGGGPSKVPHDTRDGPAAGTSAGANGNLDPGCDGNPTSAPPATPVGPRSGGGSGGSPVTHPGKGGCGPHGVERS